MDKLSVNQSSKCSKQPKSKKRSKPIKVVYISNPMKVKTSASEFRALVQELTGRDSDLADHNGRFPSDGLQMVPGEIMKVEDEIEPQVSQVEAYQESPEKSDDTLFEAEPLDDLFTSQLLENFCILADPPQ